METNNTEAKPDFDLHFPTELPVSSKDDPNYSVDVFTCDEEGLHGLAYYVFEDKEWHFHTDTLVDYNEKGNETKWKWCYPPFTFEQSELSHIKEELEAKNQEIGKMQSKLLHYEFISRGNAALKEENEKLKKEIEKYGS